MGKDRFVVNPFGDLKLSDADKNGLKDFGYNFIHHNVDKYEAFISDGGPKVDQKKWKLIKTKDDTRVYLERDPMIRTSAEGVTTDHPEFLMTGITWGTVDDCMFGAVNPSLESMRIKASYVEDMSGGAVLASLDEPTPEEPFKSMAVKWMELDLPFASTSLVKNRDYVYLESTEIVRLSNGERVGVMVFHSVDFPQAKKLPSRVRANITVCYIFRQVGPDTIEVYGSGIVDPGGDLIKSLVMPSIASSYLSTLKYAHCSKMKKMTWMLAKRYAMARELGSPTRPSICVTCTTPISKLRMGDYSQSESNACKLCVGYLCRSCRIQRKLTFVGSDMQLEQRKVSFCGLCLQQVRTMSPMEVAREHAAGSCKQATSYAQIPSNYADPLPTRPRGTCQPIGQEMGKDRFVVNPFGDLKLSDADKNGLKDFGYNFIHHNVDKYEAFISDGGPKVDQKKWKLIKTKDDTRVYLERDPMIRTSAEGVTTDHPEFLMTGITWGTVDDCMFGAVNPSLESMRIKASYVEDMSGGAVLASLDEPTPEEPFKSMAVKWMELDLPFASTSLVKNRDYVYLESTEIVRLSNGERVGVMVFHSVDFPQAKKLPSRVRANITVCCIFRQVGPDTIEVYGSGIVDPGGDMIKAFVVPSIATGYLSTLKYAHCSKMKKMTWMLAKRYAMAKELGTPTRPSICITCTTPISKLRRGDYSKSEGRTCKLCVGYLCKSCRIQRKLTFVGSDLELEQRKVSFCGLCLQKVRTMSPMEVAREHAAGTCKQVVSYTGIDSS
ncbi:hypothetical protein PHYPSEUDO_012907 [Phytophthora pseudosyringae]|uniref:FYVE-type domain-containing protein n=1 Tax=Phytophthora pseudosyringae TaxID=221518 RepID=A0A8T1W978_9STRA|nr:hypothetical protein PHYPSEUDO_012907 [Phytophthora pseudosyringae]